MNVFGRCGKMVSEKVDSDMTDDGVEARDSDKSKTEEDADDDPDDIVRNSKYGGFKELCSLARGR